MKKKVSVSLDEEVLAWAEEEVKKKRFASLSHAVNFALNELKLKGTEK
ncbi:MAG: ribbon-helix-helix domain-containing protein [Candidatus Thermoplasmatota archaeon]|jgi:hypothetical protein|nr:ribbon-helix-helix domain-containing protein [Candidatus Thermoplasmatota archaeon]